MLQMIGIRLPDKLITRIKEYVQEQKKDKTYSIGEFVRLATEEYLENIKNK